MECSVVFRFLSRANLRFNYGCKLGAGLAISVQCGYNSTEAWIEEKHLFSLDTQREISDAPISRKHDGNSFES